MTNAKDKKTITINLALWTDGIEEGRTVPKHAINCGMLTMRANTLHGIKSAQEAFNSWQELLPAIRKLLTRQGIVLHPGKNQANKKTIDEVIAEQLRGHING